MNTIGRAALNNSSIRRAADTIAIELSAMISGDQMRYFENVARIGSAGDLASARNRFAALDDELKTGVIGSLEKIVSRNSTDLLTAALGDGSELVRALAAVAFSIAPAGAPVEALIAAAADGSFEVRACAAIALGAIGGQEAVKALVGMLSDANARVAAWAGAALIKIGKPSVAELCVAMFDCADENLGKTISGILGRILCIEDWDAEIDNLKNAYGEENLEMLVAGIKNREIAAGVENGEVVIRPGSGPIKVNFLDGFEEEDNVDQTDLV